jgi:hypothetical protein
MSRHGQAPGDLARQRSRVLCRSRVEGGAPARRCETYAAAALRGGARTCPFGLDSGGIKRREGGAVWQSFGVQHPPTGASFDPISHGGPAGRAATAAARHSHTSVSPPPTPHTHRHGLRRREGRPAARRRSHPRVLGTWRPSASTAACVRAAAWPPSLTCEARTLACSSPAAQDGDDAWYAGTVKRDFDHGLFTVVYDDGERRAEDLAEMSWRLGPRASAEASARVACCARGWKIEAEATAASADAEGRPEYGEGCARAAPVAGAAVAAGAEDEAVAADVGDEAAADDPPYEAAVGDETATGDEAADDGAAAAEGGRVAAADVRPAVARDERATGALGTRTVTQPAKAGTAKSIGKRRSTHEEREERRARKRERRERRELEREARATPRDVAAGEDDLRNGEVDEYVGIPSGSSRHMDLCQTALEAAAVAGDGTGDEVLPPDPAQAAGRPRRSTGNPRRSNGPSLAAGAPIARPPGPQPPHSSTKVTSKLLTAVEMAVRDVMAEVILPAVRREVRAAFEKHTRSQVVPARVDAEKPPPVQLPCPQAANELNIISYMQRMLSRHNKNNPNSEDVALLFDDEDLRAHTRNVFVSVPPGSLCSRAPPPQRKLTCFCFRLPCRPRRRLSGASL